MDQGGFDNHLHPIMVMCIMQRISSQNSIIWTIKGAAATAVATLLTYPLQIVQARARVSSLAINSVIIIVIVI